MDISYTVPVLHLTVIYYYVAVRFKDLLNFIYSHCLPSYMLVSSLKICLFSRKPSISIQLQGGIHNTYYLYIYYHKNVLFSIITHYTNNQGLYFRLTDPLLCVFNTNSNPYNYYITKLCYSAH